MGYGKSHEEIRKLRGNERIGKIDSELKRSQEPRRPGVKTVVMEAYARHRKAEDAYLAAKMANEKIGREAFTKQIVDEWIEEYEQEPTK